MAFRVVLVTVLMTGAAVLVPMGRASADPLLVTSGALTLDSGDPSGFFFRSDDFSVWGWWAFGGTRESTAEVFGPYRDCFIGRCEPGMSFDPGMHASFTELAQGAGTYRGVTYAELFFSGAVTATAPSGVVPEFSTFPLHTLHPFSLTASLFAFPEASRSGPPLFALDLVGHGSVRVRWLRDGDAMEAWDTIWRLEGAEPIPEPGTLLLLSTGALIGARRVHRLRRRT